MISIISGIFILIVSGYTAYLTFFCERIKIIGYRKIDDSSEIIVTDKSPKIQGVFVNKSNKEKFDFNFEGILFSKNKLKSKYKFLPEVLDLTARFVKISDDFYLEKIQKNDIK